MVLKKNTVKKDALGWQIIQQLHAFKYLDNIRIHCGGNKANLFYEWKGFFILTH